MLFFLILMVLGPPVFSLLYYPLALTFNTHPMPYMDYLLLGYTMSVFIGGMYHVFFFVQDNNHIHKTRCLEIPLDKYFPFIPQFVWLYSVGYYSFYGLMLSRISSIREGVVLLFSGFVMVMIHCIFFFFWPVVTPPSYRQYEPQCHSTRFLKVIQGHDNGRCCFPSLHCSTMVFASLFLLPLFGSWAYLIMVSIALSCLLVKQHQVMDFLLSYPIAWGVYHYVFLPLH